MVSIDIIVIFGIVISFINIICIVVVVFNFVSNYCFFYSKPVGYYVERIINIWRT